MIQRGPGAPAEIEMEQLASWTASDDLVVRYFSGVGTYTTAVDVPAGWLADDARIELDLGDVRELAGVTVNGNSVGAVWMRPYRIDVTDALRRGRNTIEIAVANLWTNRLAGEAMGAVEPITFTTYPGFSPGSMFFGPAGPQGQVRDAGLLGPVTLQRVTHP